MGVGPKVGPPEGAGKGTVAQSGCQEAFGRRRPPRPPIRKAACDHKCREQQAGEVHIRTPGFKSAEQVAIAKVASNMFFPNSECYGVLIPKQRMQWGPNLTRSGSVSTDLCDHTGFLGC